MDIAVLFYKHANKRNKHARGPATKTIVVGLVEKDGDIHSGVVIDTDRGTLQAVITEHVAPGSTVVPDGHRSYMRMHGHDHQVVRHHKGEYLNPEGFSPQRGESFWALFKRQCPSTHHLSF